MIVEQHHAVGAGQFDHRAEVISGWIGEQPHSGTQLFEVGGQVHGEQMREPSTVQIDGAASVGQERDGGLQRRSRKQRKRFESALILGSALLQQPIEEAACGRRVRQPGDRSAR